VIPSILVVDPSGGRGKLRYGSGRKQEIPADALRNIMNKKNSKNVNFLSDMRNLSHRG